MPHSAGDGDYPVDAFAYYLPQFFPIELNSQYWGEGFTEWVSVLRAHSGRRSPKGTTLTPSELGFYDLRNRSARARQAELARSSGLAAFCMYHYWSSGRRILPEVEDLVLRDGEPNFPFFLGWANHDWTLMWQGRNDVVTHKQTYDEHENDEHITWLLDVMRDARYYRIGDAPVMLVYDPLSVPDHRRVFERWRQLARTRGHDLVLLGATRSVPTDPPQAQGLDAWVQGTAHVFAAGGRWGRAAQSLKSPGRAVRHARYRDVYWPYDKLCTLFDQTLTNFPHPTIPLVVSGWNNTGRRTSRASSTNSTPERFATALAAAIAKAPAVGGESKKRLVAINAWNEWGEGMTLEPSMEWGNGYLEALARTL